MGGYVTQNPLASGEITGSGTANQVAVWASASSLGTPNIPFTSSSTGFTIGSLVAEPGGILTLHSTTQGFIPPRMSSAQAAAIASPIAGITIYDTDLGALVTYTGAAYQAAILNGGNTFGADISIGTKDHQAIKFLINNTEIWRMNGNNGYLSNTTADATAQLELSSATGAGLAPIRLNSGSLIATPLAGAIEFLDDSFYATITTGANRRTIAFTNGGQTFSSAVWNGTAIGPTYGGTGLSSFSANSVLYASGADTWTASTSLTFTGTVFEVFGSGTNGEITNKVRNTNAGGAAYALHAATNGTSTGNFYQTGTGYTTAGNIRANMMILSTDGAGGMAIYNSSSNANANIYFYTNATERARLTETSGNLLVGATSESTANTIIEAERSVAATLRIVLKNLSTANGAYSQFTAMNSATTVGVGVTGTATTTSGMFIQAESYIYSANNGLNIGTSVAGGVLRFYSASQTLAVTIDTSQRMGVGVASGSITAVLHLKAGTATASKAPLKFTSGTNLTAAEAGVMEYNNTFFLTNSDATRRSIVLAATATKTTAGAPYTNDGYITVSIGGTDVNIMTTA